MQGLKRIDTGYRQLLYDHPARGNVDGFSQCTIEQSWMPYGAVCLWFDGYAFLLLLCFPLIIVCSGKYCSGV
jgi:hypothetical protein